MYKIIHLSDFHLSNQTIRDWNNYVKEALIEKLKELLASIEKPEKEILEFLGIPLKGEEDIYYVFNLKGYVLKVKAENLDLGKVYSFRAIKEKDEIKIIRAEEINVEEKIRKLLS